MKKKKRLENREQLIEAGKFARELLAKKNIIAPDEDSRLEKIMKDPKSPALPGIPAYLPYPWTIHCTRKCLGDISVLYLEQMKKGKVKSDLHEYFKFVIHQMNKEISEVNKLIRKSVDEKTYEMKWLTMKDGVKGIQKLMVDSFALSTITDKNADIVEYLNWFTEWTEKLLQQWPGYYRNIDGPKKDSTNTKSITG